MIKQSQSQLLCFIMLIKLWLEAIRNKICMLAHYIHRRLLPSFNKNGILTCDSEIIEGSWRCQLVFRFLQNIERGGKHAQKPSIFIVLLAFAIIYFFLLAILHCNWLKIMVIVSDLELPWYIHWQACWTETKTEKNHAY